MGLGSLYYVGSKEYAKFIIPTDVSKQQGADAFYAFQSLYFTDYLCIGLRCLHHFSHVLHAHHMVQYPPLCYHSNSILANTG